MSDAALYLSWRWMISLSTSISNPLVKKGTSCLENSLKLQFANSRKVVGHAVDDVAESPCGGDDQTPGRGTLSLRIPLAPDGKSRGLPNGPSHKHYPPEPFFASDGLLQEHAYNTQSHKALLSIPQFAVSSKLMYKTRRK